jgi:sugar-specific transcriptional regulator TrmB
MLLASLRRQPTSETRSQALKLIDRIRQDIQQRLEQLQAEVKKLRSALTALDPRERSAAPGVNGSTRGATKEPQPAPVPTPTSAGGTATARAAPGGTKAAVLAALSSSEALTAGEVAKATGLGRGSVSTTLSKLTRTGEVTKAKRGYRLP